jgi:hypothetical protein
MKGLTRFPKKNLPNFSPHYKHFFTELLPTGATDTTNHGAAGRKRIGARRLRRFIANWCGRMGFLQPLSKSNTEAA